jgi:hypothetical protein
MEDFFARVWEDLIGRTQGPMRLRLLVQPLTACILAVRAALRDARANRPPFFWSLAFNPGRRRDLLRQGWKDVAMVFAVAVILDVVYQVITLRMVYPGEAVVVAIVLAIVPYLLLRAFITRMIVTWRKMRP